MNRERRIIVIQPNRKDSKSAESRTKLRVAAYCRVSTEEEEQQGNFEIQKEFYTDKINCTPEWKLAGIYADDGISGVHTKKRDGFNQMIQDCKKHKIDLILTKSISRFARNTVDSIQYVRMLKQFGVTVTFEKENINTSTMNSEMLLTVLSAFAQAESESISQNISRGKRMGFSHGRFSFPYAQMLGYRKGADGEPEIIPEQAEPIRMIYTSYLHGDSLQIIKSKVEAGGYKTVRGNTTWSTQALLRILQNEKYCGDVLLQKTFTDNVLTGGPKKNTGQLPQYYIENNHEGIVTKQMYREVQAEIARRNSKSCANRLYCGECGSPYKRVTWNIHGRKKIVWRCVNRVTYGTKFCHNSPSVQEEVLHQTLLRAIQNLADNYTDEVAMQINGILHDLQGSTTELEELQQKLADSQQEFDRLLDLSLECDASFLDEKLKHTSEEIDNLQKQIDQLTASQQKAANPNLQLTDSDFRITEYSDALIARIIERIDIVSANEIKIEFIGGYTVTVPLQE